MNVAAEELRATLTPWLAALSNDDLIVQVGACIGGTPPHDEIDPIFRPVLEKRVPAILVEPLIAELARCETYYRAACQPKAFARLQFVAAAVAEADGPVGFVVRGHGMARALSTLRLDRGFEREGETCIAQITVPGRTLHSLLAHAPLHQRWGWLHADIEGHELLVLRQLARLAVKPLLVTFEHLHMPDVEKTEATSTLDALGYTEIGWLTDDAAFVDSAAFERSVIPFGG